MDFVRLEICRGKFHLHFSMIKEILQIWTLHNTMPDNIMKSIEVNKEYAKSRDISYTLLTPDIDSRFHCAKAQSDWIRMTEAVKRSYMLFLCADAYMVNDCPEMVPGIPYHARHKNGSACYGVFAVNGCMDWYREVWREKDRQGYDINSCWPGKTIRHWNCGVIPDCCFVHPHIERGSHAGD